MQTLLEKPKYLAEVLVQVLYQVLSTEPDAYGSERRKRGKEARKGGRMRSNPFTEARWGWGRPLLYHKLL